MTIAETLRRHGVGDTRLIPLPIGGGGGVVSLKAEYENRFGSVKDRTAVALLDWARRERGDHVRVVESTSGNLGLALAQLSEGREPKPLLVMDASLPEERIAAVRAAGADVEVVREPRPGLDFRQSRIARAEELGAQPGHVWLDQYANPVGMEVHRDTTGPEIWADARGEVAAVVASVGTGGTICGVGAHLKACDPDVLVVGVEPVGSTIAGGTPGPYLPAGSGMCGPSALIAAHGSVVDCFCQVPDALAARAATLVHDELNITVGPTTGAAVAVAVKVATALGRHVVVIAPDHGGAFEHAMAELVAEAEPLDNIKIVPSPFGPDRSHARVPTCRDGSMSADRAAVLDRLCRIVAALGPRLRTPEQIDADTRLREDLDLDSLHLISLQTDVEEALGIELDPTDERLLDAFSTVGTLADHIVDLGGR